MATLVRSALLLPVCLLLVASQAPAVVIPVPNGDFNDNSDGDLTTIDGWEENNPVDNAQVDNADGKTAGDLVMKLGDLGTFANATVDVGVTFDTSADGYLLQIDARAFATATLDTADAALEDDWGMLIRDMTNGANIKQISEPTLANEEWRTYELYLSQAELLAWETDNSVDLDVANIGIRFFKNTAGGDPVAYLGIDNVTLETTTAPVPGDADGNGLVELADYAIIRDNMLAPVASRAEGDVWPLDELDNQVTLEDFALWKSEFLAAGGTEAQIAAFDAVPEPTSVVVALLGVSVLALRRRG